MNNYYIKAIILKNCPHSIKAVNLLQSHKIESNIEYIDSIEKEMYKNNNINTFPQIYLKKYNSKGNLLLGGFDNLNDFIKTFKNTNYNENDITNFMKKTNWSIKATNRLIELINFTK
jgi:glutaredoxin